MVLTYIKLFVDCLDAIEPLDDGERGRLFTALLQYARTGEVPALQGNERFLFPVLRGQLDREAAAYAQQCQVNRENGKRGGRPRKNQPVLSETEKSQDKDKEKDEDKEKKGKDNSSYRARGLRSGPFSSGRSRAYWNDPEETRKTLERMDRYLKKIHQEAREQGEDAPEKGEA